MWGIFSRVLKTNTFRQTAITSFSTILASGLGAVSYLVLARLVGPSEFGLFSVAWQIMLILTPLAEMGTGSGLVRFVGAHASTNSYQPYVLLALKIKLIAAGILFLTLTILSKPLASNILHQPGLSNLLPISGLGIIFLVLMSLATSTLQGLQKFIPWGIIQILSNIIRLVFFGLLLVFGLLSSGSALTSVIVSLGLASILAWFWLDKSILTAKITPQIQKQFWNFNKWTALFTVSSALVSRLDGLLTARFLPISQSGFYSLAITMSSFLPQITVALGAVTAPKFASFSSSADVARYRKKAILFSLGAAGIIALLMLPTAYVVVSIIGKGFSASLAPFILLMVAMFVFTVTGPIRDSLLYAYSQPQFFFYISLLQGLVLLVVGYLLIPRYGINGAAISTLASHIVLAISSFLYLRLITRHKT